MNHEKSEKVNSEELTSFLTTAQKFYIRIRQTPDYNDTFDISTLYKNDEIDQPDPLRIAEIIIIICVLLLWFVSILIFIRHSQLLRIRHRDLPYRSTAKPSVNLNPITLSGRNSDAVIRSKSCASSTGGLTPPVVKHMMSGYKDGETVETISLSVSPSSRKRRHKSSLDQTTSILKKPSVDKHEDKEQLLDPRRISPNIKKGLLELHRRSVENLHQKSLENLSSTRYTTFYSTNDIRNRQQTEKQYLNVKKRCIQESPV